MYTIKRIDDYEIYERRQPSFMERHEKGLTLTAIALTALVFYVHVLYGADEFIETVATLLAK